MEFAAQRADKLSEPALIGSMDVLIILSRDKLAIKCQSTL